MEQFSFGTIDKSKKAEQLTKEELLQKNQLLESELSRAIKEIYQLKHKDITEDQLNLVLQEHLNEFRHEIYGASSEHIRNQLHKKQKRILQKIAQKGPSQRYPNVVIREIPVQYTQPPWCDSCGNQMMDSGMTEDSEQLTVTPKKYEILRQMRSIYRCSCHGCMKTAQYSSYYRRILLFRRNDNGCRFIQVLRLNSD